MTKLNQDLFQWKEASDLGRARKRKMRRENGTAPTNLTERSSSLHKPERRSSAKSGPSIREKVVATKVRMPEVSLPSIQEKLSSTLQSAARHMTSAEPGTHVPLRKAESTRRISNSNSSSIPRKSRRVYDARAEAAPPVMVRGGMGGMAFGRAAASRSGKQKQPKRRIDVPLNVTGAELRLPSVPFVHLGWRAVSFFMVLMMVASLFLIWKAPVFQITKVEAHGLQRLTVNDLNTVMGALGNSVFTLNPAIINKNLSQAFPELSKISVRVGLPASVKVVVTEREPVIDWIQGGTETWLDAQGISFPTRGTPKNTLVKVEGHGTPLGVEPESQPKAQDLPGSVSNSTASENPTLKLSPDLVKAILALGAKMPADTVLAYDGVHGLGWNDPQGWEVYFGAEDQDMEMKLTVYQALVQRLQNEGIQPALISVEYVHAPYYRVEP